MYRVMRYARSDPSGNLRFPAQWVFLRHTHRAGRSGLNSSLSGRTAATAAPVVPPRAVGIRRQVVGADGGPKRSAGGIWATCSRAPTRPRCVHAARIFRDQMATAATVDRLVHHAVVIEFDVPSYRRDRPRRKSPPSPAPPGVLPVPCCLGSADGRPRERPVPDPNGLWIAPAAWKTRASSRARLFRPRRRVSHTALDAASAAHTSHRHHCC